MTKILKNNGKLSQTRLKMFRAVQSIMKQDESELLNVIGLRKKIIRTEQHINTEETTKSPSLSKALRSWAIEYRVKQRAVSALLKILISFGLTSLPSDSRALLKTPRFVEVEARAGGQYWHNGLLKCLKSIFSKLSSNISIQLNFNIDGLPLFKSSPIRFWPILSNIHDMPEIKPMIIGIWSGVGKPNNLTEFLQPLVTDINETVRNGIKINGYQIEVCVRCFICDSPARSFLKGF